MPLFAFAPHFDSATGSKPRSTLIPDLVWAAFWPLPTPSCSHQRSSNLTGQCWLQHSPKFTKLCPPVTHPEDPECTTPTTTTTSMHWAHANPGDIPRVCPCFTPGPPLHTNTDLTSAQEITGTEHQPTTTLPVWTPLVPIQKSLQPGPSDHVLGALALGQAHLMPTQSLASQNC